MKSVVKLMFILILLSCQRQENTGTSIEMGNPDPIEQEETENPIELFQLDFDQSEYSPVTITPPENSKFYLPDSSYPPKLHKLADFNADNKKDVLVDLGACGTGGCVYGLFLQQEDHLYRLAYCDYLKNAEFIQDRNGYLRIETSEELQAYNPSRLMIRIYTFDPSTYNYEMDTSFVYVDEEMVEFMKEMNR